MVDENVECDTVMNNGRELKPRATLETRGFQLEYWPTQVQDFEDQDQITGSYYDEMRQVSFAHPRGLRHRYYLSRSWLRSRPVPTECSSSTIQYALLMLILLYLRLIFPAGQKL